MQNTCAAAYHGTARWTKDYPQRIQCLGTVVAIGLATVRQARSIPRPGGVCHSRPLRRRTPRASKKIPAATFTQAQKVRVRRKIGTAPLRPVPLRPLPTAPLRTATSRRSASLSAPRGSIWGR
jgi:hypothetical protein